MNFVLDGEDVYAAPHRVFQPRNDFVNPSEHWTHLGGGRFEHRLFRGVKQCKRTNVQYEKPKKATPAQAIKLCHSAIRNDHKTAQPKLPKDREKYTLLTSGEYKVSSRDSKYGDVVIEVELEGWLRGGLYLAICQVDLTDYEAFVSQFTKVNDIDNIAYRVADWYTVKNIQLVD